VSIIIGTISIYLWLRKQKKESMEEKKVISQTGLGSRKGSISRQADSRKPKKRQPETFVDHFSVDTGTFYKMVLPLKAGQRVKGLAEEMSNYEFDFYIMDEEQYSHFADDEGFDTLFEKEDKSVARFNVRIPHSDDWYFIFQVYAKRAPREIEFRYTVFPE
jgi:hypothetical protein